MRKLSNILIIIFVILSFYVIKDDLKVLYNRVLSFVENTPKIQIPNFQSLFNDLKISTNKVDELKKIVETPGALRVPNNIVIQGINTTDLSKEGVIKETNRNRNEIANLPPLAENSELNLSAERKINDMFTKQYFEHVSPSGVNVADLADKVGYEYIIIGENLALGNFKDNKDLLNAWMASPGHRANILNINYTEIGVAVKRGNFEGKQVWLAVQHFGVPRSSCPTISSILKGTISISQKNINLIQQDLLNRKSQIESGVIVEGNTTNEQIVTYNDIVNNYNKLISEVKNKIAEYNLEVKSYNTCLESFK